jgi:hypothetical protein
MRDAGREKRQGERTLVLAAFELMEESRIPLKGIYWGKTRPGCAVWCERSRDQATERKKDLGEAISWFFKIPAGSTVNIRKHSSTVGMAITKATTTDTESEWRLIIKMSVSQALAQMQRIFLSAKFGLHEPITRWATTFRDGVLYFITIKENSIRIKAKKGECVREK